MKRSGILYKMIGLFTIITLLYAQSAAAACVCAVMQTDMCNSGAKVADHAPMAAAQATQGAMGGMAAHCASRNLSALPCVCPAYDASHATVGVPSPPPLTHAVGAALLYYVVTDLNMSASSRTRSPRPAPPIIGVLPPPHSILHCVFLI